MLDINVAIKAAQDRNRSCWLEHAEEVLSNLILREANEGKRFLRVDPKDIFRGAENLYEAAEMLVLMKKTLEDGNYNASLTPDGDIYINW